MLTAGCPITMPMSPSNKPEAKIPGVGWGTTLRWCQGEAPEIRDDAVAVEQPLQMMIGDRVVAVTMRTPGNDEELAAGFLATEGILHSSEDIQAIRRCHNADYPENSIRIHTSAPVQLDPLERYGTIVSSCGVCGKRSIEAIRVRAPDLLHVATSVDADVLLEMPARMRSSQENFKRTGGLHAAGIFTADGTSRSIREDVGRHNAVDKVLGRAFLDGLWPLHDKILLVSGRTSFEIVQKALVAGVPIIAAVSAPSTLAIELAREAGQSLVGFLRTPTMNIYSHPHRFRFK